MGVSCLRGRTHSLLLFFVLVCRMFSDDGPFVSFFFPHLGLLRCRSICLARFRVIPFFTDIRRMIGRGDPARCSETVASECFLR